MLFLLWLTAIAAALYLYFRQLYSYFSSRGVKTLPIFPLVGNMGPVLLKKEHFVEQLHRSYYSFPEERSDSEYDNSPVRVETPKPKKKTNRRKPAADSLSAVSITPATSVDSPQFVGRFEFINPMVVIRDIELVKKITVKDFDYFLDHRTLIDETSDPLFGRNLFSLKGQEWKDMRASLSPAFTSSKIRAMVPFMIEVGDQMINALKQKIKASDKGYVDVDVKDLTTRYANDVIASCAFGLKIDSHSDVDNQFYTMGKATTNLDFMQVIKFLGLISCPKIMKALKTNLFSTKSQNFFRNLVIGTMQERQEKNIFRPDMIHLLMEANQGRLTHEEKTVKEKDAGYATVEESSVGKNNVNRVWSDNDLVAQAILFFIAGFETMSAGMTFLFYELAMNPNIQEKLFQEITENDATNGGKFDYNSIQKMAYMDMVISELLRLWPPAVIMDRICAKDYNLGKPNSNSKEDFILRKGTGIGVPIWGFHRDPQYFPEPDKFDPERFSEENKHKINPFAYMPFGMGPRNCIGSRFALCEMKVITYHLLQHIEISAAEKTCIPAQLCCNSFTLKLKGGDWVRFRIRN